MRVNWSGSEVTQRSSCSAHGASSSSLGTSVVLGGQAQRRQRPELPFRRLGAITPETGRLRRLDVPPHGYARQPCPRRDAALAVPCLPAPDDLSNLDQSHPR